MKVIVLEWESRYNKKRKFLENNDAIGRRKAVQARRDKPDKMDETEKERMIV